MIELWVEVSKSGLSFKTIILLKSFECSWVTVANKISAAHVSSYGTEIDHTEQDGIALRALASRQDGVSSKFGHFLKRDKGNTTKQRKAIRETGASHRLTTES